MSFCLLLGSAMRFFVYIMASRSRVLYIGMTNNLERRVYTHKQRVVPGFTQRYSVTKLVYFEEAQTAQVAIAREKQLKGWSRAKKIALIESVNPSWQDLSEQWYDS
ncbi:MAG: GIY-YIG nuclease family protein [Roseiflexaceae bacterium]